MTRFAESEVEEATLRWLEDLGYQVLYGAAIAPGEPAAERADCLAIGVEEDTDARV